MFLRPRYSLLTLLLFTAAIAGGMKFWRGPHSCVAADPPTEDEEALLSFYSNPFELGNFRHWPDCFCEYSYLQSWRDLKVLSVRYFLIEPQSYVIVSDHPQGWHLLLPLEILRGQPALNPDTNKQELLHHICYLADCPESELENGTGKRLPWYDRVYCISNQGKIYRLHSFNTYIGLLPVNLDRLPLTILERLKDETNLIQ